MMAQKHRAFLLDMLPKVGVPVFSATLVGCLLQDELATIHVILMSVGLGLMYLGHRLDYHAR